MTPCTRAKNYQKVLCRDTLSPSRWLAMQETEPVGKCNMSAASRQHYPIPCILNFLAKHITPVITYEMIIEHTLNTHPHSQSD